MIFTPLNKAVPARAQLVSTSPATPVNPFSLRFSPALVIIASIASAVGCGSPAAVVAQPEPLPLRLTALPIAITEVGDVAGQAYAASIQGTAAFMLAAIGEPGPRQLATLYCGQRLLAE